MSYSARIKDAVFEAEAVVKKSQIFDSARGASISNYRVYLDELERTLQTVQSLIDVDSSESLSTQLSQTLATISSYASSVLLENLYPHLLPAEITEICNLVVEQLYARQNVDSKASLVFRVFATLEKLNTINSRATLMKAIQYGIKPAHAFYAVCRAPGIPVIDELNTLAVSLQSLPVGEREFKNLCAALGCDPKTFLEDYSLKQPASYVYYTCLDDIEKHYDQVQAILFTGTRIVEIPAAVFRCPNLKILQIDDDFFNKLQMQEIEQRLSPARVIWTQGQFVEGKHGR